MKLVMLLISAIVLGGCMSSVPHRSASPPAESTLHGEIRAMDDSLSAAFNSHNADALMSLFTSDVEFYHDAQGLQDFQAVSAGFHSMFKSGSNIRRERVGPLEVYAVHGYGAIEVGEHRFCHTEGARQDCGTFKFLHLWKRGSNGWKIARVVSYGH